MSAGARPDLAGAGAAAAALRPLSNSSHVFAVRLQVKLPLAIVPSTLFAFPEDQRPRNLSPDSLELFLQRNSDFIPTSHFLPP